jgi:hypothetical protein
MLNLLDSIFVDPNSAWIIFVVHERQQQVAL